MLPQPVVSGFYKWRGAQVECITYGIDRLGPLLAVEGTVGPRHIYTSIFRRGYGRLRDSPTASTIGPK